MNASIIADGRVRLTSALSERMSLRRAEVLREITARHRSELDAAGFWCRWSIRRHIEIEVAATLEQEFPSPYALFISEKG